MKTIDDIRGLISPNQGLRVVAPAPRTYRGKRARRQAFYHRQRLSRALQRFVRGESAKWRASIQRAHLDMITSGLGIVEVMWDRGDGDGFTAKPLRDGEWPKAMLRTGDFGISDAKLRQPEEEAKNKAARARLDAMRTRAP